MRFCIIYLHEGPPRPYTSVLNWYWPTVIHKVRLSVYNIQPFPPFSTSTIETFWQFVVIYIHETKTSRELQLTY